MWWVSQSGSLVFASWIVFGEAFIGRPTGPRKHFQFHENGGSGGDTGLPPIIWSGGKDYLYEGGYSDFRFGLNATEHCHSLATTRGGSTKTAASNEIVQGSKVTFSKMSNFWKSTIGKALSKIQQNFKSKEQKEQEELMEQLKTTKIRAVSVPNSTVLPTDVVRVAVKRSGLIGSPLRTDRVQEIARNLKRWYVRKGYILHSVTGATLKPESATAEITVEEPIVSENPVRITACKEMIIDDEEILTFRQYQKKHSERKTFKHDRIQKKDLNTTLVETPERTKASKVANALRLEPGKPFQWHDNRWQKIATSGVFSRILRASPERTPDGSIALQVYVTEPPPRHLEYGFGKSLYTGTWEGEIDFEHQNLFGGGETVGLMVRRGTKDEAASYRLRYSDERFGLEGGYDFEIFNDFIGDQGEESNEEEPSPAHDYHLDSLLDRRGATFRLRNPIDPRVIQNSVASTSLERTSTRTGLHESIGSTTLTLGPFRKSLPMEARSSFSTTVTGGTRLAEKEGSENPSFLNANFLPYSSISATARQVLPFNTHQGGKITPILALQHTIATSTFNLPRHEAKAMGVAAQIRGASPDGHASSSLKGTAEVRFPFNAPRVGSGAVIFFGDWFYVQENRKSPFYAKSCIGVGFRKNLQGLPLKYDISYSNEKKIKCMFGLGPDFDA